MKKYVLGLLVTGLLLLNVASFAAPREIILVRHADKLLQKHPGPFLSAKGQVRAQHFLSYFIKNFDTPDFIFAVNPRNSLDRQNVGESFREIQTVAPLANHLAQGNSDSYRVQHPYHNAEYVKLAKTLLSDQLYDNKFILICWDHSLINELAHNLGVTQPIPKWHGDVFDTVYILKYDQAGKVTSFEIRKNQYPVVEDYTWKQLNP